MEGNLHVPFLGGWAGAISPGYPAPLSASARYATTDWVVSQMWLFAATCAMLKPLLLDDCSQFCNYPGSLKSYCKGGGAIALNYLQRSLP